MIKKISKKLKKILPCIARDKKEDKNQFTPDRRKAERRTGADRRWMSKLFNEDNIVFNRRKSERRMGERRKK
ncbi:MAG: hypothetical protein ACK4WJ_01810 [Endomicrobiia bacterium]